MINSEYKKILNILIILYAFSLPVSKACTTVTEILLIFVWLIEGQLLLKFHAIKKSNFIIILSIFVLFSILAISWSEYKGYAFIYVKKYWHFFIIPIIYTSLERKYLNNVFSGFLLGIFLSAMTSYGIFFDIIQYKNIPDSDPSPFMDHTNYSVYLSFAAIIILNRGISSDNIKSKVFYLMFFLLVTSNLFVNAGRTGQVIFIASLLIMSFLMNFNKFKALIIMSILSFSFLLTAYQTSSVFNVRINSLLTDISTIKDKDQYIGGFGQRVALWRVGASIAKDNFFFGTGLGNEGEYIIEYEKKYNLTLYKGRGKKEYIDYHNAFIQYFVQLGVVGFLMFIGIFYCLYKIKLKDKFYFSIKHIFIVSFLLLSMVGPSLHLMSSIVYFVLFSGIFSALPRINKS